MQVQTVPRLVPVKDIVFFQADQKYVIVRTPRKEFLLDEPLKVLENEFCGSFTSKYHNALVYPLHVEDLETQLDGRLLVICQGMDQKLTVTGRLAVKVRVCFKEFKPIRCHCVK